MRRNNNDQIVPGIAVTVKNNDLNRALRKFKKKVQEAGIVQEYKARQEYQKPGDKKRKAKAAGRARWLKKVEKRFREEGY